MAEKQDPRLGQIGGIDTKVCAVSGTEAQSGMTRFPLRDGWYVRVKPSRVRYVTDELIATLTALIPAAPKTKETVKEAAIMAAKKDESA